MRLKHKITVFSQNFVHIFEEVNFHTKKQRQNIVLYTQI